METPRAASCFTKKLKHLFGLYNLFILFESRIIRKWEAVSIDFVMNIENDTIKKTFRVTAYESHKHFRTNFTCR